MNATRTLALGATRPVGNTFYGPAIPAVGDGDHYDCLAATLDGRDARVWVESCMSRTRLRIEQALTAAGCSLDYSGWSADDCATVHPWMPCYGDPCARTGLLLDVARGGVIGCWIDATDGERVTAAIVEAFHPARAAGC